MKKQVILQPYPQGFVIFVHILIELIVRIARPGSTKKALCKMCELSFKVKTRVD